LLYDIERHCNRKQRSTAIGHKETLYYDTGKHCLRTKGDTVIGHRKAML